MIINSLTILKFSKMLSTKQVSKDMSKQKNFVKLSIKIIFNSFNGSKDIMISIAGTGVTITMHDKRGPTYL